VKVKLYLLEAEKISDEEYGVGSKERGSCNDSDDASSTISFGNALEHSIGDDDWLSDTDDDDDADDDAPRWSPD